MMNHIRTKPLAKDIILAVCQYYNLSVKNVLSKQRRPEFVVPRWACMYFLKKNRDDSFPRIGKALDRDHTTVMHGLRRVQDLINKEEGFELQLAEIDAMLQTKGLVMKYTPKPKPEPRKTWDFHEDNLQFSSPSKSSRAYP